MTWTTSILVVANVTADSPELTQELRDRARRGLSEFTLVMPVNPVSTPSDVSGARLEQVLEHLRREGLRVQGRLGNVDPVCAATDEWDPRRYDEIIVSTLPQGSSKWLHAGLPERVGRLTGAGVTHVVARPRKPEVAGEPVPTHDNVGALMRVSGRSWGGYRDRGSGRRP